MKRVDTNQINPLTLYHNYCYYYYYVTIWIKFWLNANEFRYFAELIIISTFNRILNSQHKFWLIICFCPAFYELVFIESETTKTNEYVVTRMTKNCALTILQHLLFQKQESQIYNKAMYTRILRNKNVLGTIHIHCIYVCFCNIFQQSTQIFVIPEN